MHCSVCGNDVDIKKYNLDCRMREDCRKGYEKEFKRAGK